MEKGRLLGWAGPLVGLFGVLLAIYFFFESQAERQFVFQVLGTPTLIANPADSNVSGIQVVRPDGSRINNTVWVQKFVVWNPSTLSIKEEHILLALVFSFSESSTEIIDFVITNENRPTISQAKLRRDDNDQNAVRLNFVILENKDSVVGQITYIGKQDSTLILRGAIEGVAEIRSFPDTDWMRVILNFMIGLGIVVMSFLIIAALVRGMEHVMESAGKKIPTKYRPVTDAVGSWGLMVIMMIALLFFIAFIAFGSARKVAPINGLAPNQIQNLETGALRRNDDL